VATSAKPSTKIEHRHALLTVTAQATERFDAAILAYYLMDNHYHLVIHAGAVITPTLVMQPHQFGSIHPQCMAICSVVMLPR